MDKMPKTQAFLMIVDRRMNLTDCDNKRPCPCTYDCPRHGKRCAWVTHHRDNNEGAPGCFFSAQAEATYDRSIEALCQDRGIMSDEG